MNRFLRLLLIGLIVLGVAVSIINFTSIKLSAGGWVEKEGTFDGKHLMCPGDPKDCVHRIYVE